MKRYEDRFRHQPPKQIIIFSSSLKDFNFINHVFSHLHSNIKFIKSVDVENMVGFDRATEVWILDRPYNYFYIDLIKSRYSNIKLIPDSFTRKDISNLLCDSDIEMPHDLTECEAHKEYQRLINEGADKDSSLKAVSAIYEIGQHLIVNHKCHNIISFDINKNTDWNKI